MDTAEIVGEVIQVLSMASAGLAPKTKDREVIKTMILRIIFLSVE
jgi:hypothetical protein